MAGRKGRKGGGKGTAARRQAQMERLAAGPSGAGEARRSRAREAAANLAAAGPSAARWLVGTDGRTVAVDVVADLLRLDPRTSLRSRGGDELRTLAGHVADLLAAEAVTPSGRPLAEVVTDDVDLHEQLRPTLDLDALLAGGPVGNDHADRSIRVAEALLARAAAHRAGEVDLHALVAPVGAGRHPRADEVETTVRVAVDGLEVPASHLPAVVTVTGGWVATDPVELFLAAGRGLLTGATADVGGAALTGWLTDVARDPTDPRWLSLTARVPVDAGSLLQQAAARAGSDHPDVAGPALVELIGLRHPIAPPS